MNRKKEIKKNKNKDFVSLIFSATAITLYFNPKLQDPFNAPKFFLLVVSGFYLIGKIISSFKKSEVSKQFFFPFILVIFFVSSLFISTIFTDNRYVGFFGEYQRKNGFLTYFCLAVFFIASMLYVNKNNLKDIYSAVFFVSLTLIIYGLMQANGKDFVAWNNPYNSVIGTLGNPNFSAAVMSILASILFGTLANTSLNKILRFGFGLAVIMLTYVIYLSQARQGLISLYIAIGFYLCVYIYLKRPLLGKISFAIFIFTIFLGIMGMLQKGPLSSVVYKNSVSIRGYYWRAGLEMFQNNLLFGVGVDRFGSYFKEYREENHAVSYGFNLTSSAAHNVPIQLFATSGIFVGISYLLIIGFTLIRGIKSIKNFEGSERLVSAGLLAAWLAFQAQSIVSIDNIGIAIWGWILGGCTVGYSYQNSALLIRQKSLGIEVFKPLLSASLALISLILIVPLYKGESMMYQQRIRFQAQVNNQQSDFSSYANQTLDLKLLEPRYKLDTAINLVSAGEVDKGMRVLVDLLKSDPRNLDTLGVLADFSEKLNLTDQAIKYRLEIAKLDPWNAKNYLNLGLNYKIIKDYVKMNQMREKVISFASGNPETLAAKTQLVE